MYAQSSLGENPGCFFYEYDLLLNFFTYYLLR